MWWLNQFPYEFQSMVDKAVSEMIRDSHIIMFRDENKFEKKIVTGVVLYSRKKNVNDVEYKKPRFDRRISSMRIFTHTKK